eukprot:445788_1
MAQTASIFDDEGGHNNHHDINDDILTAINQTPNPDEQHIQQSIEMRVANKENNFDNDKENNFNNDKDENDFNTIENNIQGKRKVIIISFVVLIAYSVIISTIALIIALNNASSTSSSICDCTVNNLAAKTELTETGVGSSGFCNVINFCVDQNTDTTSPTFHPSTYNPTTNPSVISTINPSNNPSEIPTQFPTKTPTKFPSKTPTNEPTMEPTLYPTDSPTYFDEYFIGDFKFSLKSSDHGYWKLCDGTLLLIDGEYSLLFHEIGFKFGAYNETILNVTYQYFAIPNVTDSVVGIGGKKHLIGEHSGYEEVVLTNSNIPAHTHKVIAWAQTSDGTSNYDDRSICQNGFTGNYGLNHCPLANGWATGYQWQYGSNPISIMQPTAFISNLFIYTGVHI